MSTRGYVTGGHVLQGTMSHPNPSNKSTMSVCLCVVNMSQIAQVIFMKLYVNVLYCFRIMEEEKIWF